MAKCGGHCDNSDVARAEWIALSLSPQGWWVVVLVGDIKVQRSGLCLSQGERRFGHSPSSEKAEHVTCDPEDHQDL
ncbi:hypothetical protein STEG23_028050 [Scotinomys teguina]